MERAWTSSGKTRSHHSLPTFLARLLVLVVLTPIPSLSQPPVRLVAYLTVGIKAKQLESLLSEALPGVEVTVFGRLRDFQNAIEDSSPQMAMAAAPVLEELRLDVTLQGHKDGQASEPYVLVAQGAGIHIADAPQKSIGIIDLLGRAKMPALVTKMLDGHSPKKVKRVTKEADLMGLLQFDVADAILVRKAALARLQQGSQMVVTAVEAPSAKLGLPAVWFASTTVRQQIAPKFAQIDSKLNAILGVDEWR